MSPVKCGPGLSFVLTNLNRYLCAVDDRLGREWYVAMSDKVVAEYSLNGNIDSFLIGSTSQKVPMCEHDLASVARRHVQNRDGIFTRDEPSTTHNSTHFLTCVVYVLCIRNPRIDMCGHVCHMSTQLFKKCVSKSCIFTEFNQK